METVGAFTNLDAAEISQDCEVLGLDGRVMQLKLLNRVDPGSPVKVEASDTISLGEVSDCHPQDDGYLVRVELLQALHNVAEMTRLARALLT